MAANAVDPAHAQPAPVESAEQSGKLVVPGLGLDELDIPEAEFEEPDRVQHDSATQVAPVPELSVAPPAPNRSTEDLAELAQLSDEAGALGEELHTAQMELDAARAEQHRLEVHAGLWRAWADLAQMNAVDNQNTVDSIAVMQYRGGGTGAGRAAILATDPENLLDRLSTLQVLSNVTHDELEQSTIDLQHATQIRDESMHATQAARDATAVAEKRASELETTNDELQLRIAEVRLRVDALDEQQLREWVGGPLIPDSYSPPPADSENGAALSHALDQIGKPYSWGATGPDQFDCSGLMVWSYTQVGKTLPRSSQAQVGAGTAVSLEDIEPGDLVIYYPEATHVGMYAGNGLVVHAPDYGIPVKLDAVSSMPIHAIRRY